MLAISIIVTIADRHAAFKEIVPSKRCGTRSIDDLRCLTFTDHPTGAWTAQQLREAFPWNETPRYLLRDGDSTFHAWASTATAMEIHEVVTAPHSPWQSAY